MRLTGSRVSTAITVCGGAMLAMTMSGAAQQPSPQAPQGAGRGGGRGGGVGPALFTVADSNKDGAVSRDELKGTFDKWYTAADASNAGSVTAAPPPTGTPAAFPGPPPAETPGGAVRRPQKHPAGAV